MKDHLTEKEETAVKEITSACNRADGTGYAAPIDADEYLLSCHDGRPVAFLAVYAMGDTFGGRPVEELMLFTDPAFRGKHRAARLMERYRKSRQEEQPLPVLRFSSYPSAAADSFLNRHQAQHDHDELLMTKELVPAGCGQKNGRKKTSSGRNTRCRKLSEQEFTVQNSYSECSVRTYGTTGYIYAVRTDESHLRCGSAQSLLQDVLVRLAGLGADHALLEVSSANIPAVCLYRKLGFRVAQTLRLHILPG